MNSTFLPRALPSVELTHEGTEFQYRFEADHVRAINIAVAAGRPLLIQGEPGVGKSELARAAAKARGGAFVATALTAKTEADDLLFHFDAVGRLAQAQVASHLEGSSAGSIQNLLKEGRFTRPGVLWWAFNWKSAVDHLSNHKFEASWPFQRDDGSPTHGVVVLLDEIDKAESAVPNALLEALGSRRFSVPHVGDVVRDISQPLLVVITTNDERSLPDAFIRRCMVLKMETPTEAELLERGKSHSAGRCTEGVLRAILGCMEEERRAADRFPGQRPPGQAEFLDAVRALSELAPRDETIQKDLLESIRKVAFQKHRRS